MIGPDIIPAWVSLGLCAQTDPALFFPDKGESPRPAKRICADCPVATQCLNDALNQDLNPPGIWGGTTHKERTHLRQSNAA